MKKKILAIALVITLCLTVSACSTATNSTPPASSAAPADNTQAQDAAQPSSQDGGGFSISVAHWMLTSTFPAAEPYMEKVNQLYAEKYPDARIEWNPIPSESGKYHDLLKAQLASNSAPDVFFHQNALVQFGKAGYLTDLSDQAWADQILESTKVDVIYEGKLLGIPVDISGWGVFYNKEVFDTYNLTEPKTFDDLLQICETLVSNGVTPFNMGFKDEWPQDGPWLSLASFVYGTDENYPQNLYDGKVKINSEAFTGLFQAFEELVSKGYISKSIMSTTYDQAAQEFGTGKVAMQVNGPWCVQQIQSDYGKDVGFFNIPDRNGNTYMTTITNSTLSLNSRFADKEKGIDMLKALTDEKSLQIMLNDSGFCGLKGVEIEQNLFGGKAYRDAIQNNKSAMQINMWTPVSTGQKFRQLTTLICSGKSFDASYLDAADADYEKDKELLNMK